MTVRRDTPHTASRHQSHHKAAARADTSRRERHPYNSPYVAAAPANGNQSPGHPQNPILM